MYPLNMNIRFCLAISAVCLVAFPVKSSTAEPPKPVAHRGLLQHAPENTIANFRACLELRLGFEFDVAKTNDGHLICIVDDTVDRTPSATGMVADLTLEEIRQLDAGSGFDAKFSGEKVPTIDEVLKLVALNSE